MMFKPRIFVCVDYSQHHVDLEVDPRIVGVPPEATEHLVEKIRGYLCRKMDIKIAKAVLSDVCDSVVRSLKNGFCEHVDRIDNTTPLFEHDCPDCAYLGTIGEHDLYFCQVGFIPTVIARYGDQGHEYKSGIELAKYDKHLWSAAVLAEAYGLASDLLEDHHSVSIRKAGYF